MQIPIFIRDFLLSCGDKNKKLSGRKLSNQPEEVEDFFKDFPYTPKQTYYLLLWNLSEIPKCPVCGKPIEKFYESNKPKYCSSQCARKSEDRLEKVRQTNLKKYGVPYTTQTKEMKEQTKETCLQKYGVENVSQSQEIKNKVMKTMKERYGVENYAQTDDYKEKYKTTCLERYGVENVFQREEIKEKVKNTNIERYGHSCSLHHEEIQKKVKKSIQEKYGVDYPSQSEEIKERCRETCLKKYGVDNYAKTKEYKEKFRKTMLDNYGVEHPSQSVELRKKQIKTVREQTYDNFLISLKNRNLTLLSSKNDYINLDDLQYQCKICNHIFYMNRYEHHKPFCPECNKNVFTSKNEKSLVEFIKSIYSGVIVENDRTILDGVELDVYIPEKKVAIEFNGSYWHSSFFKDSNYHLEKTKKCQEKGIRLIHIFEYEWDMKKDICKSLLSSSLGIYKRKIYARKCVAKEIDSKTYREFLENNHLQGSINSSVRYGLFYEDELISVIGFGKSRFKNGEVELHRFCSSLNCQVIGGFSKLIKHSKIKNFISYIDLAHFDGRGYESCGFKIIAHSKPSYVYVKSLDVLSRFQCQKHRLKNLLKVYDESLTEEENMEINGYHRIYDCGNLKVVY